MRVLSDVRLTPEQLKVVRDPRPGTMLIRGAAGSGKTTTAVRRLQFVAGVWLRQHARSGVAEPLQVLVLTYNRTLRGYVEELVERQVSSISQAELTLDTFGRWSMCQLGFPDVLDERERSAKIWQLGQQLGYTREFLLDEVDYVLGRFLPSDLSLYADPQRIERTGRGTTPRVDRKALLERVIFPYQEGKTTERLRDWNDLAVMLATREDGPRYEVIVVDEAQDFSGNQVRAVVRHASQQANATFVLDAVQRIYPSGFTSWREVGVQITGANSHRLSTNHRNTKQIAAFAYPLVAGLPPEDDGTLPEFENSEREGPQPLVVRGRFADQMQYVIEHIGELPDDESVALLHPKGGGWFSYVREVLRAASMSFVEITRRSEWPQGPEEIALCTMHSSKGLEFDHVVLLGLNAELMPHGSEENDTQLLTHRKLVAMAIGRARKSVMLTYKPGEESRVVDLLDPDTYEEVDL
ncbi:MAG TPA: 3'-5' exonuclease [Solirubrobacteraceae bacterium]|jgi:superfamily I DNA/RNA helicase|nr:3'-5' exonuclease [Solirubrobacteraceae bacterium]